MVGPSFFSFFFWVLRVLFAVSPPHPPPCDHDVLASGATVSHFFFLFFTLHFFSMPLAIHACPLPCDHDTPALDVSFFFFLFLFYFFSRLQVQHLTCPLHVLAHALIPPLSNARVPTPLPLLAVSLHHTPCAPA
jgi:hypothetical protein